MVGGCRTPCKKEGEMSGGNVRGKYVQGGTALHSFSDTTTSCERFVVGVATERLATTATYNLTPLSRCLSFVTFIEIMTERHRDVMFPSHKPPIRSFYRLSVAASAVSIVCVYVKAVRCSSIQIIRVERNSRATFYYLSTRCTEYIVYNSTRNTFCRTRRLSNATFSF